jgi:DNA-binding GntR family transcriptional regulator
VRSADLVDALRARIAAREIGPRGALPSELDLAREYVSRADVERSPFYDLLPLRGLELGTAHQIITAEIADATTAAHLACEVGDPLLVVRRTTHDAAGAPVLYSEHRYPAARTTFEIEFSLRSGTGVLQHA